MKVYLPYQFTRDVNAAIDQSEIFSDKAAGLAIIFAPFLILIWLGCLYGLLLSILADTLLLPFALFNFAYARINKPTQPAGDE